MTIGADGSNSDFSGEIASNSSGKALNLSKTGNGKLHLSGSVKIGTFSITGGSLIIDGAMVPYTPEISFPSGTTLMGHGSITGDISLHDGTTLSALSTVDSGDTSLDITGTLKFNGETTLNVGFPENGKTASVINVSSSVSFDEAAKVTVSFSGKVPGEHLIMTAPSGIDLTKFVRGKNAGFLELRNSGTELYSVVAAPTLIMIQ